MSDYVILVFIGAVLGLTIANTDKLRHIEESLNQRCSGGGVGDGGAE